MHIPDGFLTTPVWATLDAIALPSIAWLSRRAARADDRKIPLLGVMGAFVFAAQMINFPVGLGTSGHLVGGTLLAVTLGPAAAAIVMTAILVLQALVLQDGGILALGANVCNMALAGVLVGYLPVRLWGRTRAAIFAGGLLSVLVTASLALGQLLLSGVAMPPRLLWISVAVFVVSGVLEGVITVAAFDAIKRMDPRGSGAGVASPVTQPRAIWGIGLASAVLLATGFLVASAYPDGLQKLIADMEHSGPSPAWLAAPLAGAFVVTVFFAGGRLWARRGA